MALIILKRLENMYKTEKRPSGRITYLVKCSRCGKEYPKEKAELKRRMFCLDCSNEIMYGKTSWNKPKVDKQIKQKRIEKSDAEKKFYRIWDGIKSRCKYNSQSSYERYGGRGIKCKWENYNDFKNDMYCSFIRHYNKHGGDTTIDRIDVNGDYCKGNCRWLTMKKQQSNRRDSIKVKYKGVEYPSLMVLCESLGQNYSRVYKRYRELGWDIDRAIIP